MTAEQVTRESRIVYITDWATRYRCSLQLNGEVGFGRGDCKRCGPDVSAMRGGWWWSWDAWTWPAELESV